MEPPASNVKHVKRGGREDSPRAMRGRAGERERLSGPLWRPPPLAPKPVRSGPFHGRGKPATQWRLQAVPCRSRSSVDLSADRLYRLPAEGDLPDPAAWELAEGDCTSRIALRRGVLRRPRRRARSWCCNEAAPPNCASRDGGGGKKRDTGGGSGPPRTGSGSLGRPHPQRTSRAGVISRRPPRGPKARPLSPARKGAGLSRRGGRDDGPGNWPGGVLERW